MSADGTYFRNLDVPIVFLTDVNDFRHAGRKKIFIYTDSSEHIWNDTTATSDFNGCVNLQVVLSDESDIMQCCIAHLNAVEISWLEVSDRSDVSCTPDLPRH